MHRSLALLAVALLPLSLTATASDSAEQARIAAVTRPTTDFSQPEQYETHPAGAATSFKAVNRDAYSQPSANMSFEREMDFKIGNGFFRKVWVSAPSSTQASDGLGPLYNARACQNCHLKDGRGAPPAANYPDDTAVTLFLRLSIPPQTDAERAELAAGRRDVIPEPTYGGQLQNFSVQGLPAEGQMHIDYTEQPVTLADGTVVSLRLPRYSVTHLAYGPLHPETLLSPRIAPPMIGLGLLEAIPEDAILAHADPDDTDKDGISGRPNRVWSMARQQLLLGRFGWKAGQPSVLEQSAGAFNGDMGISTPLLTANSGDCTAVQVDCLHAPHGGDPALEVSQKVLDLVDFYSRNLAVPARRKLDDPTVLHGKRVFYESGCTGCHTPKFVTRRDAERPEQSFQLIWPYSDLLLHDMGEGLADHRPEAQADGREWRTPPLWGIGLTETVSGHTHFLHDGRARNLLEAILWHGGEAEAARQRVVALNRADREALLAFLNSL